MAYFPKYFEDSTIKQEDKILTLDILNLTCKWEYKDPDKIIGLSLILFDIDGDNNYMMINSWGEKWSYKGTFKAKRECLKILKQYIQFIGLKMN